MPLAAILLALMAFGFLAHLEIGQYSRRLALQGSPEGGRLARDRHAQRRAVLEQNYKDRLMESMGGRKAVFSPAS